MPIKISWAPIPGRMELSILVWITCIRGSKKIYGIFTVIARSDIEPNSGLVTLAELPIAPICRAHPAQPRADAA